MLYGRGRGEPESPEPQRHPGGNRDAAIQAPVWEAPVISSLTEKEREELSKKVSEANRRSSGGTGR
ncbi:hypothetical protein DNK56_04400 [Streptomyces sp. AC1-42W]|nr:hypothetical protein DNK55_27170 [Streptomyces sp. AC1-42T]PZT81430.1 hypothetical protein DNK56_04400 [Streptomyces sp. AC1-42W]